ncbi:MAG TPA: hypothetical protein VLA50_05540 [Erythrobacter sp.]|nr:hypothetical protein [Erythrobacter sp.]
MNVPIALEDVRFADTVVTGTIQNYRIIRDQAQRDRMLAQPSLSDDLRALYESDKSLLWDYAQFDIVVDEVLLGQATSKITVTWDNSTFGEPESLDKGPYLIALRQSDSPAHPLRGPSAAVFPNKRPDLPTLLQAPCSSPFLFVEGSPQALEARSLLKR